MANTVALLVIDAQNGMFDGIRIPPVYNATTLLANLQILLTRARQTATPIIFIQHMGHNGHPLEPDTQGWHLHPSLRPQADELVIQKTMPDSFYKTSLQETLVQRDIRQLVVSGIQTDLCVDTTCRRAASLDYEVHLVSDGHSTWDNAVLSAEQIIAHHNAILKGWFVSPIRTAEVSFEGFGQRTDVEAHAK